MKLFPVPFQRDTKICLEGTLVTHELFCVHLLRVIGDVLLDKVSRDDKLIRTLIAAGLVSTFVHPALLVALHVALQIRLPLHLHATDVALKRRDICVSQLLVLGEF